MNIQQNLLESVYKSFSFHPKNLWDERKRKEKRIINNDSKGFRRTFREHVFTPKSTPKDKTSLLLYDSNNSDKKK